MGDCINNYRKQKLVMAPGSEPDTVKELIRIIEPYVYGKYQIILLGVYTCTRSVKKSNKNLVKIFYAG